MTTEAKVGSFTLLGLAILAASLIRLSGFSFGAANENTYQVLFPQVLGLKPASPVQYAGVHVGRVVGIEPEGTVVRVTLKVQKDLPIPKASHFSIAADGLLGEKFVSIAPRDEGNGYLADGATINGASEATMDTVMDSMSVLITQMHDILSSINEVIGNPEIKAALHDTAINMQAMTKAMAATVMDSQNHITALMKNLEMMTGRLTAAAGEVDKMMSGAADNGQTALRLRQTIENISLAAKRVDNMAKAMEGTVTDPETADHLKATLKNAHSISERMDKILAGNLISDAKFGAEAAYATKGDEWQANLDLELGKEKFIYVGLENVGQDDRWDAQIGQKFGNFRARGGLVRDHFGLGLDYDPDKRWRFSADVYDSDKATLKVGARYRIFDDTYLFTRLDDVTKRRDKRTAYFGVRQEF